MTPLVVGSFQIPVDFNCKIGNNSSTLMEKMLTKLTTKQKERIELIFNRSLTPKSQLRAESEKALAKFLKSGGSIQVVKSRRRK